MAQFLRPDSNVTQTSFTGGFAEIDESTASDADFAYGAINTAATLEVGLSNPSGTPGSGTTTVRYRIARTNGATVDGGGNSVDITCHVYQGTTLIASDTARTATGTWTQYSFTPSMASVTDWNDLRLRFVTTASGGGPSVRRGAAVSWAEMETPDAGAGNPALSTLTDDFSAGSVDTGKWATSTGNGTVSIASGTLDLTTNSSAGSWAEVTSVNTYSLSESEAYVQVVRPMAGTVDADGARTIFRIYDATNGGDYVEWFIQSDGVLVARTCDEGTPLHNTVISNDWATSGYSWLKISKSGATATWWTAPDSSGTPGTWTSRHTYSSLPSTFASAKVLLSLDHWGTGSGTIVDSARFDGFNTAASGASAVGADLSGSYGVVSAVGADRTGSYAVVAAVGQDRSGSYAIVESVGQSQAGSYAVVSAVGADHAGAYGIGGTVGQDSIGSYGIAATVSADAAGGYAIHEAVGQDAAGGYGVVAAVGQDQAGAYGIDGTVGQDSAGSYAVVAAVGQDSAQSYGVVAAVGQDCAGSYAIEAVGVVGSNLDGAYAVLGAVGQDHAGTYSVVEIVGGDQAGAYAVLESAGQDQAGAYSIVHAVGQEQAGTYGIAGAVGQDIAGSYGITATVTSDSVGQYQVLATVAADGAGTYAVLEAAGADLTQVYALIAQVAADLAGGYAVESVPLSPFAALEARINRAMFAHLSDTEATLDGVAVTGMFEDGYARGSVGVIGMAATQPVFVMPTADIGGEPVGLLLVVGSTTYVVGSHEPDGTGVSRLLLELAA